MIIRFEKYCENKDRIISIIWMKTFLYRNTFLSARDRMGFYDIHGMPSGHAQSFFYFMTYLAIFVILKYIIISYNK
jgi:hypothetical protein